MSERPTPKRRRRTNAYLQASEIDYRSKLTADEKAWLLEFDEACSTGQSNEVITLPPGMRRALLDERYARERDVLHEPLNPKGPKNTRRRYGPGDYLGEASHFNEEALLDLIAGEKPKQKKVRKRRQRKVPTSRPKV